MVTMLAAMEVMLAVMAKIFKKREKSNAPIADIPIQQHITDIVIEEHVSEHFSFREAATQILTL